MAAVYSEHGTPNQNVESFNKVFSSKYTLDYSCDVVHCVVNLVVEDGKQFKAHRKVLSEASPFFEKLLNSDMKESKDGIVRLEMFSESAMAATLEFIYTGHVEVLTEDNARDLIVMADYLLLPKLKALAEEVLAQKLNISNCISTYYFSETYQCEDLLSKTKKFILANFTAVYTANREDVLNMSRKEIEMWISRDEIDVSAEEDVFKIILAWTNHDKNKRRKYFAELFRQVRLVYVSRDFLCSDVVTNDLVKENENCLDLAKDAMSIIDSKNCDNVSVPPRKSLETPVIVMRKDTDFLCYFPDEDNWCKLGGIPSEYSGRYHNYDKYFPCEGKLYREAYSSNMVCYNPYTNSWLQLSDFEKDRDLWKIFLGNEDEMYALLSDRCPTTQSWSTDPVEFFIHCSCGCEHKSVISKYKPESHSWEDVLSFDPLYPFVRERFCIVAADNFIYFIGGAHIEGTCVDRRRAYLSDVDRYDLTKCEWDKVADIRVARRGALGAAVNGKVFIAGGDHLGKWLCHCEVYDEKTNEWQFIASFKKPRALDTLLTVDSKLYAVSCNVLECRGLAGYDFQKIIVECYSPEKNEWEIKSKKTFSVRCVTKLNACPMRIFKGLALSSDKSSKQNCLMM